MERMDDRAVLAELLPLLRATFAPSLPVLPPPLEARATLPLTLTPPLALEARATLPLTPYPNPYA